MSTSQSKPVAYLTLAVRCPSAEVAQDLDRLVQGVIAAALNERLSQTTREA